MGSEKIEHDNRSTGAHSVVVAVYEDHVWIRLALPDQMRLGDRVSIHRVLDIVPDPDEPKRQMDSLTMRIGEAFITGLDSQFAMAVYEGTQPVLSGDMAG